MKVVLFCRVSTSGQEYDRQVNELLALALSSGWSVEGIFAEKISGAKKNVERAELMKMVEFAVSCCPKSIFPNGSGCGL